LININEKFHELGVPDNSAFPTNDIGVSSLFGAAQRREKEREQQQLQQKSNKREVSR